MRSTALLLLSCIGLTAASGCAVVQTEYGEAVAIYATGDAVNPAFRDDEDRGVRRGEILIVCTGYKTMQIDCWRPSDDEEIVAHDPSVVDDVPMSGAITLPKRNVATPATLTKRPKPQKTERYEPKAGRPPQLIEPAKPLGAKGAQRRTPRGRFAAVY